MKHLMKSLPFAFLAAAASDIASAKQYVVEIDPSVAHSKQLLTDVLPVGAIKRSMLNGQYLVIDIPGKGQLHRSAMAAIRSQSFVKRVEEDIWVTTQAVPNDALYSRQWYHFEDAGGVRAQNAHDITRGEGSVIAVIDTGYVPHPDLDTNRLPGYDMISNSSTAGDGNGRDGNAIDEGDYTGLFSGCGSSDSSWHGAHVAGISSAVTDNGTGIAGIAPLSKFVPVRALGRCGGTLSDIADGVVWSAGLPVAGAPLNQNPADVINLSLGGTGSCTSYMQAAINQAVAAGSTVVVAAGNSSVDARGATPANCQNVITVASTGRDGARASYSNFGSVVDIAAPGGGNGGGILSTIDRGRQGREGATYAEYQGTSMATPVVAGVIALMRSVNKDLTPAEVEAALSETARSFPGTCAGCGAGIVDATAAVLAVDNGSQPEPEPQPAPQPEPQVVNYGGATDIAINDARRSFFFTRSGITRVSLNDVNQGSDVTVSLVIRHARASDLSVGLTGTSGQRVALSVVAREGDDYLLEGQLVSAQPGDYLLTMTDSTAGVRGSLLFFGIEQSE